MPDWDRKPPQHRVNKEPYDNNNNDGCASSSIRKHVFSCIAVLLISFLAMLIYMPDDRRCRINVTPFWCTGPVQVPLNFTYPLSSPQILADGSIKYRIAIITDLDHNSKVQNKEHTWQSFMKTGYLTVNKNDRQMNIIWDSKLINIYSTLSQGGRGMELSDLKVFDGNLLTIDDRTGVIYRIIDNKAIAWTLLNDGDGNENKGFKGEWLAIKNGHLYVGGLGKEWTTTEGAFQNYNPMFVKKVSSNGEIQHINWTKQYIGMRSAAGFNYPGYMIHESAQWSDIHKKWFFLPRRASNNVYTEKTDEKAATNLLIEADENFEQFVVRQIGKFSETRGFSAFQFVPNTNDNLIVALKSEEDDGKVASYILAFELSTGEIILPETKLNGAYKFEGIEFI